MKKYFTLVGALLSAAGSLQAAALFTEQFNYPNGPLIGQGPWVITGSSVVNPVQVVNQRAALVNTGQDVNAPFSSPIFNADGSAFYYGLTINVSAAQATGDYFAHLSASSSLFYNRLFIQASGPGFVLGLAETAPGSAGTVGYGSTVLNFGADYRVVVAQNVIAGNLNDTFFVYVDPTDKLQELNNQPYLQKAWNSLNGETNTYYMFGLRQGTATSAPTLQVDDIAVGKGFADVTVIPEPGVFSLLGAFAAFLCALNFRRKS